MQAFFISESEILDLKFNISFFKVFLEMEWVCIPSAGELDRLSIWRLRLLCTLALGQACNSVFPSFDSVYFVPDIGCNSLVSTGFCLFCGGGWIFQISKTEKSDWSIILSCMIINSRLTNVYKCQRNNISIKKYWLLQMWRLLLPAATAAAWLCHF